jgi:uncharacterized protein YrrD
MDLGNPVSYLVLAHGTAVIAQDGQQIGTVEHVLADEEADVFDGVIVHVHGGHRFADAEQIAEIHERGVVLNVDAAALPEPSANPAALAADPADTTGDKLRRAWDYLSGNY